VTRAPQSANGYGDARAPVGSGRLSPDDVRQFRREFQELDRNAEQLRQQLQAAGMNPREFDDVIRDLQGLSGDRPYADPRALEQLIAAALDRVKKAEFNLRRKIDSGNESLALSGSDEVPAGFRTAIEEYYRSLAKRQTK
jgi:hypothetical protein